MILNTVPVNSKNGSSTADTGSITKHDLYDALQLGWTLVELRSRVQVQLNERNTTTPPDVKTIQLESRLLEIQPGAALLRGGLWGALLNRIALLHDRYFPDSATAGTLYDLYPANKRKPWALFPRERPDAQDEPDYADLAIPVAYREKQDEATARPMLPQFGLYEAARRALNCLILLYLTPDDTLIWDIVSDYQRRLIENMDTDTNWKPQSVAAANTPAASSPGAAAALAPVVSDANSQAAIRTPGMEGPPHDGMHPHSHTIDSARDELTVLVVRLLEAWESYLRGQYNRSGLKEGNESRLVSLEAGRNMASLSWCLSSDTVGHKMQAPDLWLRWNDRFDQEDIIRVQRQISAMGNTLDDLYYDEPGHERPGPSTRAKPGDDGGVTSWDGTDLTPPDPEAPGTVAEAINHSLDYWQRAVAWLQQDKTGELVRSDGMSAGEKTASADPLAPTAAGRMRFDQYEQLRTALIEQSNIWQLLLTGQQKLGAYSTETIRFRLQASVFDALEEASTDQLLEGSAQVFNEVQQLVHEATNAVEDIAKSARDGLQSLFRNISPFLLVAAGIGVVSSIFLLAVFLIPQFRTALSDALGSLFSLVLTALAGGAGWLGLRNGNQVKTERQNEIQEQQTAGKQKVDTASNQLANMQGAVQGGVTQVISGVRTIADQARKDVEDALNRGLAQVQVETRRMDYGIGVTAPLIEFFLFNFKIEGDYSVLTDVLWSQADREEELQNITRAAFGPLSLLLGARRARAPLAATITSISRSKGTDRWVVSGTVRGEELKSYKLLLEPRPDDAAATDNGQPTEIKVTNPKQPVLFGKLGEFNARELGLKKGVYKVTLVASGEEAQGTETHEVTSESIRWVDIPDLSAAESPETP